MLPKQYRFPLRQYPDFFRSAKRLSLPGCMVFRQQSDNSTTPSRATVVVSKKTAARATARNLIKRRFHAALTPALPHSLGYDFVFVAKQNLAQKEITSILEKVL